MAANADSDERQRDAAGEQRARAAGQRQVDDAGEPPAQAAPRCDVASYACGRATATARRISGRGCGQRRDDEQREDARSASWAGRCARPRRPAAPRPGTRAVRRSAPARSPVCAACSRAAGVLRACSGATIGIGVGARGARRPSGLARPAAAAARATGAAAGAAAAGRSHRRGDDRRLGAIARDEHVAAVGVLVDVGRQLAARVAQLRGRVVALEHAVVLAVPDDLDRARCVRRRGDEEQCREQGHEDGPSHRRIHASSPSRPAIARAIASAQACVRVRRDRLRGRSRRAARGAPESSRRRRIAAPSASASPRGHDEPGALVLDEPTRGGSDGIGGDHGDSLVEGFVDDEPPRLEEVARGDRRYDHNVAARVGVAQFVGASGPSTIAPARSASSRSGPSPASTSVPSEARSSTSTPFSAASRPANRT